MSEGIPLGKSRVVKAINARMPYVFFFWLTAGKNIEEVLTETILQEKARYNP